MRTLIILLMLCGVCEAREILSISLTKVLTDKESVNVKKTLSYNKITKTGNNLIHLKAIPYKNDYKNNFSRGTVKYNNDMKNYSYHKVIIPDGTTVRGNFTQVKPHTQAITGKNLHFVEANLVNVELDPTWTYEFTLRGHFRTIKVSEETIDNKKQITHKRQMEKNGKWIDLETETEYFDEEDKQQFNLKLQEQNI